MGKAELPAQRVNVLRIARHGRSFVPLAAWILGAVAVSLLLALYALPWAWIAYRAARSMHVRRSQPDPKLAKLAAELTEFKVTHGLDAHEP